MKKFKNKKVLTIAAILLVLVTSVGLAGAFFSDYEHAIGQATFALGGDTTIDEHVDGTEKTISILNRGDGDAFVRVSVYGPDEMTFPTVGDGWRKAKDGFWYYQNVLPADKATSTIVASISEVPVSVDLAEFDVIVVHESVPVVYDTEEKADFAASWGEAGIHPEFE